MCHFVVDECERWCLYIPLLRPSGVQAIADKMKGISSTLTLTITRTGDLHLQVTFD